MDSEFKVCPFCKEQIRKEAVKCRFCGEWLNQEIQTQTVETSVPPPLPTQEEIPKPVENEVKTTTHENGKGISPKKLYWIGAILLAGCGLILFVLLYRIDGNQLNPEEADKATSNLATLIVRTIVCAGLLAWTVKRKGFRFLTFAGVCAAMTIISAYYFHVGKKEAAQKSKETWTQLSSNGMEFVQYAEQGATGTVPAFHPTGDTDIDALAQVMNGLIQEVAQTIAKMNQEINALQEQAIFEPSLLTNKVVLGSEASKRSDSQEIINKYEQTLLSQIKTAQEKCKSLNVSDNVKRGGLDGLNKSVTQYQEMLDLRLKEQKSEFDFLHFLSNSYDDYQLKDGQIFFGSSTNGTKYDELAKNVQDASKEIDIYLQEHLSASKTSFQKLAQ
jgi:hypothetical protein